jgi:uncharacterized delta-60 repeat protein
MPTLRFLAVAGLVAASVVACSGFAADNSASTPPGDTDSGDVSSPEAGPPSVGSNPNRGITLTVGDGKTLFVVQSRTASIPVKLAREGGSIGPVTVTVPKLPVGATVDPLTVPAGATDGTLTLHASASTPQGPVSLSVIATEQVSGGATSIAMLDAFVRGLPGTLDTTFGDGGVVKQVFSSATSGASDVKVMKNGAIVISGHRTNTLEITRLTPAGALDTTFGSGTGRTSVAGAQGALYIDIHEGATPADGFISCVSFGTTTATVCRSTLDGVPDTTFNNSGQAPLTLGLGNLNGIQTIALANGSALVLTNHFANHLGVVSRWKPDGTLDTTYGTNGTCQLSGSGTGSTVSDTTGMFLRSDGASVRVAMAVSGGGLMKGCNATGALDTTLGSAPDYFQTFTPAGQVAPNIDGGFVFLGGTSWSRVNAGFVGDTGIGSFGTVSTAPLTNASSPVVQADGAIVVLGDLSTAPSGSFTLMRFKQNGVPDPDFGSAGIATLTVGTNNYTPAKLIAQPDGRLLVIGTQGDNFDGFIARLWD